MTSGPRAIAVGLVLHPTNLVQPLMSELSMPELVGEPGRSLRWSATPSNRQGRPTAMSSDLAKKPSPSTSSFAGPTGSGYGVTCHGRSAH